MRLVREAGSRFRCHGFSTVDVVDARAWTEYITIGGKQGGLGVRAKGGPFLSIREALHNVLNGECGLPAQLLLNGGRVRDGY